MGATLLKALQAVDRPALSQLERHGSFLAALGAHGDRDGPRMHSSGRHAHLGPFAFASLAPLGFVLETLLGVKELFTGRKHKFATALDTFQHSIAILHALGSPFKALVHVGGIVQKRRRRF